MAAQTYRKKPVEIQAMRLEGSDDGRAALAVASWCGGMIGGTFDEPRIHIDTLEGTVTASAGDYVIRGVAGEFYPCKPHIFTATYELVE